MSHSFRRRHPALSHTTTTIKILCLTALIFATGSTLRAGDLTSVSEATAFVGGIHIKDGGGHSIWGASAAWGFAPKSMLYVEFSHAPTDYSNLLDFHGGWKQTLLQREKFEPYALVGAGLGHVAGRNYFGVHLGAGARYYVRPNWGVQPEIRYTQYLVNGSDGKILRYTGGVFFQWGR